MEKSSPNVPVPVSKSPDSMTRNNAVALLDELLNQEKHLSKILIIKRESADLNRLVKSISDAAADGAELLKSLKTQDHALEVSGDGLPPGEKATRDAIAKTKQDLLLHTKDAEFEFQLLLTQAEALGYGEHLARIAAENDSLPDRARRIYDLSNQLHALHKEVIARLRTRR